MMGRPANAALVARWQERLGRWRSSGLSISEFCRREEISQPSFFAWRKRLAGRNTKSPRFVELPPLTWPATSGVQIALPGGATVTLPPQAATELVTAAIRAAMPASSSEERRC